MSKCRLYGRSSVLEELKVEKDYYNSYSVAITTGQQRYGWGNFMVEYPGGKVPSRREQLLRKNNLSKREVVLGTL